MERTLHFGAIAFSPRAKAACHGVGSSFWEMQSAYYRCLDRVEAGGKP